ncbi:hypothetical protein VKT23_005759 [Stygiomarasmius scandens]|uniref:Copper acquisition factor BIM1-like domain-containing protein n=1 Tax=Marasmiellus scandens TaxID=2682957 RepID=A0ABR1JTU4_9AGAR
MRSFTALSLLGCVSIAAAHFQLQFPDPRGVFDEDNEPNFCDGYNTPASNRTQFPLSGGFYSLNSEHPTWSVAALISNSSDPQNFDNFELATQFAQLNGEGVFCLPLNFSTSANATAMNLKAGDNVTIQIQFSGGDGDLFQCADLTLSNDTSLLQNTACSNATDSDTGAAEKPGLNFALSLLGALGLTLNFL